MISSASGSWVSYEEYARVRDFAAQQAKLARKRDQKNRELAEKIELYKRFAKQRSADAVTKGDIIRDLRKQLARYETEIIEFLPETLDGAPAIPGHSTLYAIIDGNVVESFNWKGWACLFAINHDYENPVPMDPAKCYSTLIAAQFKAAQTKTE